MGRQLPDPCPRGAALRTEEGGRGGELLSVSREGGEGPNVSELGFRAVGLASLGRGVMVA